MERPNTANGMLKGIKSGGSSTIDGEKTASSGGGGHSWIGDEGSWASPSDPEALPRLGWYLYLLTKDLLGFRSSNAAFVRCLQVVLASLGVVVWNSSPRGASLACSSPASSAATSPRANGSADIEAREEGAGKDEGDCVSHDENAEKRSSPESVANTDSSDMAGAVKTIEVGGTRTRPSASSTSSTSVRDGRKEHSAGFGDRSGGAGCGYVGERALLAALSASGRCSADEVRAMSARVVEVIEALLDQEVVVSVTSSDLLAMTAAKNISPTPAAGGETPAAAAEEGNVDDAKHWPEGGASVRTASDENAQDPPDHEKETSEAEANDVIGTPVAAGRAGKVAGVFHPSVAAENAARLDSYYWASVSARRTEGEGGGIRVLDEAFVLTPSLRCVCV